MSRGEQDPFHSLPEHTIAYWDFDEVDGEVVIHYASVRHDLRGQGLFSSLVPQMKELLGTRDLNPGVVVNAAAQAVVDKIPST